MSARFQRISKTSASIHASKRILPFSCDRIAASASRSSAIPSIAARHLRSARSVARQRRPRGERGLRRGDRVGDVLLGSGCRVPGDDARFSGIGDRQCLVGLALRASDEQSRADCLQCLRHGDQAPLCDLRIADRMRLRIPKQVYLHSCLLVNQFMLLSPRRSPGDRIGPQAKVDEDRTVPVSRRRESMTRRHVMAPSEPAGGR